MDRNSVIGLVLIFGLFFLWAQLNSPSKEELERQQFVQDSIKQEQMRLDSLANLETASQNPSTAVAANAAPAVETESDSLRNLRLASTFGAFAASATGTESEEVLENDLFKITFSNKGGKIKNVTLKDYFKTLPDSVSEGGTKVPVELMEDNKNIFEYLIPMGNVPSGSVSSNDLYFQSEKKDSTLIFRAYAGNGKYFEQTYTVRKGTYNVDYDIQLVGLSGDLTRSEEKMQLNWVNYLDKLELNTQYERNYTSVYYKQVDEDPDYCSCTSDDQEDVDGQRVNWVAFSNQFFNTSLIAETPFQSALLETKILDEKSDDLKKLASKIQIPIAEATDAAYKMDFYLGPNEFNRLKAYDADLEDIVPYGWSIFGTINRWIIRPLFQFLSSFIGSAGLVILLLTVIVKLLLYPLTYKMLYSQSKMAALKPRLAGLKEKFGDDQQKQQMETMKLYQEFGVSPLGGCLPIALQMPIWFALYRFFPGSIEFRQASFLWADDLSSFDVFAQLPFEIPFYGAHVSLFTLLWAGTTVIYTYYNTKHMEMTVNPAMKYMQYLMPVMFLFFFNNFASGLTCYLLFSNMFNIGQTIITKDYIIDKAKIKKELEEYRKKPKKKNGFQARLEAALREQQKAQQATASEAKPKKKKKK
ncbi:MAG: membrane protein insertase YidC [Bacteroidota bacterium]